MQIYPAIDLHNGKCVRLFQGRFDEETVYDAGPIAMAEKFVSEGATWLHVIDLNAAKNPEKNQTDLIIDIFQKNKIKIQTGGGIRTAEHIKYLIDNGVERVIVGSQAVKNPKEVTQWFKHFSSDRLVLACDVKRNKADEFHVATHGWQLISEKKLFDLLDYYVSCGLKHLLCTDIDRDGTLEGPNFYLYKIIAQNYPLLQLQASGGMSSIEDIKKLREKNLSGAIIGRAIYEKKFSLKECLSC